METLNEGQDWKTRVVDRESWKIGCVIGWS